MNRWPHCNQDDASHAGGSLGNTAASEGSRPRRRNWRCNFWLPSSRTISGSLECVKESDALL
eukprot:6732217-Lingulodinium_polyedra.AAC.1